MVERTLVGSSHAEQAAPEASKDRSFEAYAAELDVLLAEQLDPSTRDTSALRVPAELDGGAGAALRRLVSLEARRAQGAFFTPHALAAAAVEKLGSITAGSRAIDPACGAGDLLLAAARTLPLRPTLSETLRLWGECLAGLDQNESFVTVAKKRLALLALYRGAEPDTQMLDGSFPGLGVGDGARWDVLGEPRAAVVLNPPFGVAQTPQGCGWSSGSVARAAVFAADVLERCGAGTRLVCILPDVLRSGTRYGRWRGHIGALADMESIDIVGRFDPHTNVDVFLLALIRRAARTASGKSQQWASIEADAPYAVGDLFLISVGAVVAYRSPLRGRWQRYLVARGLSDEVIDADQLPRRRFSGRLVTPPFVVVRRTSKPTRAAPRVLANVVTGKEPVAVENHLLVLEPKDGSRKTCERLTTVLRSRTATELLDERIRCRHLTVAALCELPWDGGVG